MSAVNRKLAAEFLREQDRDRYISTLVLNGSSRDAVIALYAFSADVAAIRSRVSEPRLGEIRLQWWNDALTGQGAARSNPLADCLLDAVAEYTIPPGTLQRLLGARRFDLYDDPMPDMASFEGYAGETNSTLYQLAAMVLNKGQVVETGDAAGHLGVAHALIGHLRAFGYNAAMGRMFLPWSIFVANGAIEADVFSGKTTGAIWAALTQFVELAGAHLGQAESAIAALPGELRPAFASLPVLKAQHKRLLKTAPGPYQTPSDLPDWAKIAKTAWWTMRSRS